MEVQDLISTLIHNWFIFTHDSSSTAYYLKQLSYHHYANWFDTVLKSIHILLSHFHQRNWNNGEAFHTVAAQGCPSSCNNPTARSATSDTETVTAPSASNIEADYDNVFQNNQDCMIKFTTASYCQGNQEIPFSNYLKKDTVESLIWNLDCKNKFEI